MIMRARVRETGEETAAKKSERTESQERAADRLSWILILVMSISAAVGYLVHAISS